MGQGVGVDLGDDCHEAVISFWTSGNARDALRPANGCSKHAALSGLFVDGHRDGVVVFLPFIDMLHDIF